MKVEHSLTPYTQKNSNRLKDLNVKHDNIKLPEENRSKIFSDINHNSFLRLVFQGKRNKSRVLPWWHSG